MKAALGIGYRHIDTAEMYGNAKEVGQAVRDAGLDRADVKLSNGFHKPDDARRAFDNTLIPSWLVLSREDGLNPLLRKGRGHPLLNTPSSGTATP